MEKGEISLEYTVKALAELTGVSSRTLRYYDQIGLLKPAYYTQAGYRMYGEKEVDLLQQILFYRAIGFDLSTIQKTIHHPEFDIDLALARHYQELQQKKKEIDALLQTVEQTIAYHKGEIQMTDQEKFEAFKKEKLAEHEQKFGDESRKLYGKEADDASKIWANMTQEQYDAMQKTEQAMFQKLKEVAATGDLDSETANQVYELHKKWLMFSLKKYHAQKHVGIAQLYLADDRFQEYYRRAGDLSTEEIMLLVRIIEKYAK